jgi:hypothetical protein
MAKGLVRHCSHSQRKFSGADMSKSSNFINPRFVQFLYVGSANFYEQSHCTAKRIDPADDDCDRQQLDSHRRSFDDEVFQK